jgi:hypothetical protein
MPVDRVMSMLEQVRTGLVSESVGESVRGNGVYILLRLGRIVNWFFCARTHERLGSEEDRENHG